MNIKRVKKAVFPQKPPEPSFNDLKLEPSFNDFTPESQEKIENLTANEILERIDQIPSKKQQPTFGLTFKERLQLLQKMIVDSFLRDTSTGQYDFQQFLQFLFSLRLRKPEIAVKLLIDNLKLLQQDNHFVLSEKGKDSRQEIQKAPLVIFAGENNKIQAAILDKILPEQKPKNLEKQEDLIEITAPLGLEDQFEKVRQELKLSNLSIKPLAEQAIENLAEIEAMQLEKEIRQRHTVLDGKVF